MSIEAVLIGAGGFGREILDVVEAHNSAGRGERIEVVGVGDDRPSDANRDRLARRGYRILGTIDEVLTARPSGAYLLGVGNPQVKSLIASRLDMAGWRALRVTHPAANVGSVDFIGEGAIICGGVQLSTNTSIGRHVHLNPNSTVGHDSVLHDFVSVNPGAIVSGDVEIGPGVLIGAGAVVLQGLTIAADTLVGASACVTKDIAEATVLVGVPAKPARAADPVARQPSGLGPVSRPPDNRRVAVS